MKDISNQLTVEESLLISLCRLSFSRVEKENVRILMEGVTDWKRFVAMSNEHGIIALCHHNIMVWTEWKGPS
jgi:hypothetical protein